MFHGAQAKLLEPKLPTKCSKPRKFIADKAVAFFKNLANLGQKVGARWAVGADKSDPKEATPLVNSPRSKIS